MPANLPDVTTYVELRLKLNKPWLDGPWGRAWQTAMGQAWDAEWDLMKDAAKVGWPQYAPADGLGVLGSERNLERIFPSANLPGETEDQYRLRLKRAWGEWGTPLPTPAGAWGAPEVQRYGLPQGIWDKAGTAAGHVDAFGWTGLTSVAVYRQHEWAFPLPLGGPLFQQWQTKWPTFYIVISPPHNFTLRLWGAGTWGPSGFPTWGTNATYQEVNLLKRLAQQFASGHSSCAAIVLQIGTGMKIWGVGVWGAGTWGIPMGGAVVAWPVGEKHWWEPETIWPVV